MSDDSLTVELSDGRRLTVPLAWYPRLLYAPAQEREIWQLVARRGSAETAASLQRWLAQRKA